MNFAIKIKEKSFTNKHNNSQIKVLKNIDINIKSKEFVCIVGPSGCGKTTLMNMIGGLVKSDNSVIQLNNSHDIDDKFGYVFQTSRLLPWLTVKENVALVCDKKNFKSDEVNNILENFGLKDFINYYPKSISGGMRRRVALARAFINNPQVLLMDEPFVSLDQPTAENLYEVLVNYWKKKPTTIILITHVLKEAILLGDRVLFFSKNPGTVVFDYKVNSERKPLSIDSDSVNKEYNKLTKKYPNLLNGLL
ncbi:MAG: ATP-binding cassette domain-containing protein [Pseudomonadota bacterium]|nr:ATP-binding cassette domain-containing protein [Pseudomonadota bacterium]